VIAQLRGRLKPRSLHGTFASHAQTRTRIAPIGARTRLEPTTISAAAIPTGPTPRSLVAKSICCACVATGHPRSA